MLGGKRLVCGMGPKGGWKEGVWRRRGGGNTSFIGAVVSGIAVCVVEEKGTEEGREAEY
jgi:hypothetical protein